MSLPIRVYATDFRGKDFEEDSTTVVVNRHGGKIRLTHQLLPEQEIRIFSQRTGEEAVFRVVSRVGGPEDRYSFWGVECMGSRGNIWGVSFPTPTETTSAPSGPCSAAPCAAAEKLFIWMSRSSSPSASWAVCFAAA